MFHVHVKEHNVEKHVKIIIYGPHNGHDPSSWDDVFYFLVHKNVLKTCMEDLWDIGLARAHCQNEC